MRTLPKPRRRTGIALALLGSVLCACQPLTQRSEQPVNAVSQACIDAELALQVLGSGGPIADDERASSAYLIWYRGHAIALIDVGGGSFQRFGAAGANLEDLSFIALSHLHTDHSADLPALLKGAYFSSRQSPLPVFGPQASAADAPGDSFPSLEDYLLALFGPGQGAYRYLAGLLDGSDGLFQLQAHSLATAPGTQSEFTFANAEDEPALRLRALGVHHGSVPALAYRVEIAGHSIVFSGDQSAANPQMAEFARDSDLLVAHVAIPPGAGRAARSLHRDPQAWAELATAAATQRLVLSHWMQRSLSRREDVMRVIEENYSGRVVNATDLACIVL